MNKFLKKIEDILKNAGIEEFKKEAEILLLEVSNLTKEELLLLDKLNQEVEEKIENLALKRAKIKAPLWHILGYCYFMGEKYLVNENVLIPRDETELLVLEAYKKLKNKSKDEKINILDIGVGSGCISCALAHKLKDYNIEILSIDKSSSALIVALENVSKQDLIRKIILRKSDLFSKIRDFEKFDLIISNPPYIPISMKETLQDEVKNFDPSMALFANDDEGVEFYQKIIEKAPLYLKENGLIAFELGINQAPLVQKMLEKYFKNIEIIKDLAKIDRVILASLS